MNLLDLATYGPRRHVQLLADYPEARLVLFSLSQGQEVSGSGEPRVFLLCLEGEGELWAGNERRKAGPGELVACEPGEPHGAKATGERFLVLGIIAPRP